MELLAAALFAFLGSAAAATWLGNRWERRKVEAEELMSVWRQLSSDFFGFSRAVGTSMGLLGVDARHGKVWNFQRKEFSDALDDAHIRAAAISASTAAYAVLDITALDASLAVANAIAATLDTYDGVAFVPAVPGGDPNVVGVRVDIASGEASAARAHKMEAALKTTSARFTELWEKHRLRRQEILGEVTRPMRVPSKTAVSAAALALVACYLAYWYFIGSWQVTVQDDRVVWTRRFPREVVQIFLDPPSPKDPKPVTLVSPQSVRAPAK